MNGDLQLKLQAWVDGELASDEARRVESLVASDREAAALVSELRTTRTILSGNEAERMVPASRDFYWSQIRREIERAEAQSATATSPRGRAPHFWNAFRRMLVPTAGLGLVVCMAALSVKYFGPSTLEDAVQMIEVENLSEDMSSMSYRSHADKMFVVYVYSKEQTVAATDDDSGSESMDDLLFQ
jgi:anti-sigma factor RsiW